MAILAVQRLSASGSAITTAAAAGGGDSFSNTGQEFIRFDNGSGGAITVTFVAQRACNHGVLHDATVTVPAGQVRDVKPLTDTARFNDSNNRVQMTYSGVTDLEVGVYST